MTVYYLLRQFQGSKIAASLPLAWSGAWELGFTVGSRVLLYMFGYITTYMRKVTAAFFASDAPELIIGLLNNIV